MNQVKCAGSERLVRLGISMAQLHILYTLQRAGEMPMSRLADVLNVSLSNATGLIDRVEERGFIERTRVPEDRRIVMIRVTDAGRKMLDEVDAVSTDLLRSVFGRIGRTQVAGVGRAFPPPSSLHDPRPASGRPTVSPRSPAPPPTQHPLHGRTETTSWKASPSRRRGPPPRWPTIPLSA
jgi:DNA-binding MarR family transcriptional regulator